ncbi:ribosome maturation factor [Desulfovibrio subterraneus]|jgi:ribosome maturation factor RimP|uniref:Ribosome maturation factor RimP n=1 Tax=Desulfovibrio subterraneus TaxID=2718620 RepID=A0A7J0BGS8_9BACT|nr:ribosome maturation factor [Desulfovibrio subterraneus]WBF69065.1 ribosome maturation factor [Desulfovibrio subterraneus]GFM32392.1 ribosome maturation factor RimP [Desulfovibrio subterraneus]
MSGSTRHSRILAIVEPIVESMNLTLWGLELGAGPRLVVRIYVEGPEGVNIDQCADISRHTGLALEVEDIISGAYILEVSSPGLERPFFSAAQMAAYVGSPVVVVLREPHGEFSGRRKFPGTLQGVNGEDVTLSLPEEEGVLTVHWNDIKKAHLVHVFPDTSNGKKKR